MFSLWLSNSTSGYLSEETQNTSSKDYMHSYVNFSIIYNCQDIEAAQVPINRWVDRKLWYIYKMEYLLISHKKKEILPFATAYIDLESIMLSEVSQSQKDKYHMVLLYVESNAEINR